MNEMYDRIQKRCKELGVTPSYMCDKLGIRRALLSDMKKSKSGLLSSLYVVAVADYLNMTCDELLTGNDPATSRLPDIGSVSSVEIDLIKAWRKSTEAEQENIAFMLRAYGFQSTFLREKTNSEDAV